MSKNICLEKGEKMSILSGKKILLIANKGYFAEIIEEFSANGAVGYYIGDTPNEGFFQKVFGRLNFKPYIKLILDKYYYRELEKVKNIDFDYVLCIRGEYTSRDVLERIRSLYPKAKLVLYMWDSLQNNKHIKEKWDCYDSVLTFDRKDYLKYKSRIGFLPLFYCESRLPKIKKKIKYDISFVGTGHQDRVQIVKKVRKKCEELGLSFYAYVYSPHIFVFLFNKLFNKYYRRVRLKDVRFKRMSLSKAYAIYSRSNVILDVESSTQTGLTMRTIENIGTKKKLLTTNADIINYDFYNENNVCVFNRKNVDFEKKFFCNKYQELPEEIYNKYSLKQWVINVLS